MSTSEKLKNLVTKGLFLEALDGLDEFKNLANDVAMLRARVNALNTKVRLNTINNSEYNIDRNRILQAILSLIDEAFGSSAVISQGFEGFVDTDQNNYRLRLLKIIKDNERKNVDITDTAKDYLKKYTDYFDAKALRKFFDRDGSLLMELNKNLDALEDSLTKLVNKDVDKFIDNVMSIISEAIPDWSAIDQAYTLCVGRGFSNKYIDMIILKKSNDNEAKLKAVGLIEEFLESL